MSIDKVFIIGSGLMGSGIAQVCAQAGLEATLSDVSQEQLDKAVKNIAWSAGKLIEKGKVAGTLDEVMGRISTSVDLAPAAEADLVMEVVFENLEVKQEVFAKLNQVLTPSSLVASNTSAIPISELAAHVERPERFLGIHFFSPVPMMQAVEVIRGTRTNDEAFAAGREFVLAIKKEPIMVNRDVAGFVINRINFPSTMEAMRLVEQGVASVEDIDKGLRLASGRKMGIFETGDMVGLDVTYGALMAMYQETREEKWYPPFLLRRKVKAGQLGRKTGVGWYRYDDKGNRLGIAD
ncbi:MAG: 3-hydroxyacyl-CoA dehydrogenase family protein [Desulfarculaceae bacterium]|nr:3-hydroxyacyl-CoA dehydrogenase family protein [Desulfarculaceae bacterium]MCF8046684.1 3-hydroxyacyl-CoA dehydrogenase family protein [Desulfarculaceae bacterium]MCF8097518.1 3-hydroxyacyl-CoA dehydrogenase family protein [Desulfarculaceae bacterium]MCF8121535.1 3-hydroxyacyl-CoA dehydrogenase family protein [Desulfarculaceae bacterium]